MSDLSQDSSNTKASVAEDFTAIMSVAAVTGGRSFAKLIKATGAKKPRSVPAKPKGVPKKTPGLSPVHQANTAEEMSVLLTPLISKRFVLSNTVTKKLHTQLALYFKVTGIVNKLCFRMVTESSSWECQNSSLRAVNL